jgi:hypothetical protein
MSPQERAYPGPFVQIACVCQTALQEANSALSVIRIMDRVQVLGTAAQMQPQPLQNLSLVIVLKSGALRETHQLKIQPVTPSGAELPVSETSALFEGEDRGIGIVTPLTLVATESGLYWIDVYLEEQLLTRIPLRVLYNRVQVTEPFQAPPTD